MASIRDLYKQYEDQYASQWINTGEPDGTGSGRMAVFPDDVLNVHDWLETQGLGKISGAGTNFDYTLKQLGMTPEQLLMHLYGPGRVVTEKAYSANKYDDPNYIGTVGSPDSTQYFYQADDLAAWQAAHPNNKMLEQRGSAWGAFKDAWNGGLGSIILMAAGGGLFGGGGGGLMPTAAGETAGLAGSVTGGGGAGSLASLVGAGDYGLGHLAEGAMESGFSAETAADMLRQGYDITNLSSLFSPTEWQQILNSYTSTPLPQAPGIPPGAEQAPAPVQEGPTNPGTGPNQSLPPSPGTPSPTTATSAGSALSRLLEGKATAADYLELAGKAGSTLLGALGANSQTNALEDIAEKNFEIGAPSRLRYEGSYAPGFTMMNDPGYKDAIDAAASAKARALSVTEGNPFHSPSAMDAINKHVVTSTALPALYNYRSQNINSGGMGLDMAGRADLAGAEAGGGIYDALGYGLSQLTRPSDNGLSTLAQLYKSLQPQRAL